MSLVKKKAKVKKRPSSKPQAETTPSNQPKSRKKHDLDEEIASDDESIHLEPTSRDSDLHGSRVIQEETSDAAESDDDFFTASKDKRLELAKRYLEKIGANTNDEGIAAKLRSEAQAAAKKLTFKAADSLKVDFTNSVRPVFYRGHKDAVTCVALPYVDSSKSSPTVAFTGSKDCSIIQWDLETGKKTIFPGKRKDLDCQGHFEAVLGLAVSEDGKTLVSAGADHLVRVWDVRAPTHTPVGILRGHQKAVVGVAYNLTSGDSPKTLFTTSKDLTLRSWNLTMMALQETFYGHTQPPTCIDILGSDRPVTGGEDGTLRVWKIASESHLIFAHHQQPVDTVLQLHPTRTLSGSQDGSISLWDVAMKKPRFVLPSAHNGSWITALGGIRYSDLFFSGSDDGVIRSWKVITADIPGGKKRPRKENKESATLEELTECCIPIKGIVNGLQVAGNGKLVVAAIGREHRHGRWKTVREAQNGLLVARISASLTEEQEAI